MTEATSGSAPRLLPMLAGAGGVPSDGADYQFEPKLDGQRIIATVDDGVLVLTNRRGLEATTTFPELRALAGAVSPRAMVLDGEVVTLDAGGRTSFQRLQRRMHVVRPSSRLLAEVPVTYAAFDVLWLDGELLIERPQHERRRVLDSLGLRGPAWQTVPVLDALPGDVLQACRELGLEGFMAKRRDGRYQPGRRSPVWRKVKCGRRRELVVGGWSAGQGSRATSIGSLALGCFDVTPEQAERRGRPQRLFYVGQAGSGLTGAMIGQLQRLFAQIEVPTSPFDQVPPLDLRFVRPLLAVEVAYTEVTESGTLRQPSIKGLRTDVVADEVVVDDELAARLDGRP